MTWAEADAMFQRIARALVDAARDGDEGAQRALLLCADDGNGSE
jgi:hypothetical protein